MNIFKKTSLKFLFLFLGLTIFYSCQKEPTATKVLMQGNWELTAATDSSGKDILSAIAFPVTVMQLTDDNGMLGTQGPMFTRIVYGGSKWIEVSGKIKQVFDYANFRFNTGEFFLDAGVQERFTVEAKLQATAAAGGLKDILEVMGVDNGYFQQVVYHKFSNVKVNFPNQTATSSKETEDDIMIWEFDNETTATYNYKDANGNYVLWNGWPVNKFQHCTFTFTKKIEGINDIVKSRL